MQLRMPSFQLTDQDRRAVRFVLNGKRTAASRDEARDFVNDAVKIHLAKATYRYLIGQGQAPVDAKRNSGLAELSDIDVNASA